MNDEAVTCPNCKGDGELYRGNPPDEYLLPCDNCDGTGSITPDSLFYEWARTLTEKGSGADT